MRTYYIQNNKGEIQGYYIRLKDAKFELWKYFPNSFIQCLSGQYRFEGYHLYKMIMVNSSTKGGPKFIRQRQM